MSEKGYSEAMLWVIAVIFATAAFFVFAYGIPYVFGGLEVVQLNDEQTATTSEAIKKNVAVPFRWVGYVAAAVILLQPLKISIRRWRK